MGDFDTPFDVFLPVLLFVWRDRLSAPVLPPRVITTCLIRNRIHRRDTRRRASSPTSLMMPASPIWFLKPAHGPSGYTFRRDSPLPRNVNIPRKVPGPLRTRRSGASEMRRACGNAISTGREVRAGNSAALFATCHAECSAGGR